MAVLVARCPRCRAKNMTFDVRDTIEIGIEYGWQRFYEAFSVCRNCHRSITFVISQKNGQDGEFLKGNAPTHFTDSLNPHFEVDSFVCIREMGIEPPPEHVPGPIALAFREGAASVVIGCWNAAGAMFRLAVDLTTRPMLPKEDVPGLNKKVRRDLGLRLPWLFANGILPKELEGLSSCIREDGNDGVHAGSLTREASQDLQDFTIALLERIFTEPERVRLAEERRAKRRSE
jgi:Domain of unknown function (DUF4145)